MMIRLTIQDGYMYTTVHGIAKAEDGSLRDGVKRKYGTKITFPRDRSGQLRYEWVKESVEVVNDLIMDALNDTLVRSYD